MSLSVEDWQAINRCLIRIHRDLDAKRNAIGMLEAINELVPGVFVCLNYFTPPEQLEVVTVPENALTAGQVALIGKYVYQSPFVYFLNTEDASWKMTTDFMPIGAFKKLEIYRLGFRALGIDYKIGAMLASVDNTAHVVTIHRSEKKFTEHEREILNALHPHLVTSHVNALAFSCSRDSVVRLKTVMEIAPGAYGYFNSDHSVAWVQPKAQAWLMEFFPDEVKATGSMPRSIPKLIQKSERCGGLAQSIEQPGVEDILVATVSTSTLQGWILRLERKQRIPRFRPLAQLSSRKNQVLRWMIEGKRNGEIASILGLSPRTVEKHVQDILAALKVENRTTAILRAMDMASTSSESRTLV
jgi:DNA-binding CsgD family transcriptional regulator